jgi:serine/threonine-protein kinase
MTDERRQRLRDLFDRAVDLPAADQGALLGACCADDPDLRAHVERLLACDARLRGQESTGGFLDGPLVRPLPRTPASAEQAPVTPEANPAPTDDRTARTKADARPGRLGRYELLEEIGRGGMGAVLRGHDPDLRRDLAVKVLLPELQHNPDILRRFTEEAQIGGQLQHPGVVPVYEVGRSPDQRPYFTMKLVKGRTLAALLRERGDPGQDLARFEHIFEQVCQTMAYAHSRGVIHRDLKPANIMVGAFGEVQVMDWGLAKVLARADAAPPASEIRTVRSEEAGDQTKPGWVGGTPAYMAPEQAAGAPWLDERCDVFGLGAILCEILTGQPPYGSPEDPDVFLKAARADLTEAFSRLDACGADGELIHLARSALAAEPADRPRDAGVLAAAMAAYRESLETRLRQTELAQAEARARAAEERKRRRLRLGLAAVVLLTALLAGGGWLWLERRREGHDRQGLEALAQANLLHQQAQAGSDLGKWAEARTMAHRALAQLEEGTGRPEPAERARELLRTLDEAEADRRLLARLAEMQLVKVQDDVKGFTLAVGAAAPQYAEAFAEYGLGPGTVPPEEAAARIKQRPPPVQARIVGALDDWLSVLWVWAKGDPETARWVEAVVKEADPDPWRQRLRVVLQTKDQEELQRLADEVVVARQPPWTLMLLGMLLRGGGPQKGSAEKKLAQKGLALMRRAQGQYPGDFWVNFELAWQLQRDPDKTDDPVRFYRAAVALRPDSALVRYTLATALIDRGEQDNAITVLREAASVNPDIAALHFTLGYCLAKRDRGAAIKAYRRALELEPDAVGVCRNLAALLIEAGDRAGVNEVIDKLQQIVKRKPNRPDAYRALGDLLLLEKRDRDGAIAAFRAAKDALPPDDFDAHFDLGRRLKDVGLFDEALATFRHCQELATKTKQADLQERVAQAVRDNELRQWLPAGREHARRREWDQAARCYARLLNRDQAPNDELCFEHAAVLLLSGDHDGYRNAFLRMLERCGKEKGFRAFLAARACTLAPGSRQETARAGQLAEKELTANPRAFWLLTQQAALHYRAGRFDRALPLLEQSLKIDPRPGSAVLNWLWLALTCQKLGDKAQARSWLEKATTCLDQYREGLPASAHQDVGLHLHNWLEAHILRREAEAGLGIVPR